MFKASCALVDHVYSSRLALHTKCVLVMHGVGGPASALDKSHFLLMRWVEIYWYAKKKGVRKGLLYTDGVYVIYAYKKKGQLFEIL